MNLLESYRCRDPACRTVLEIVFLYSGFHAIVAYRIANFLHKIGLKFLARLVSQFAKFFTGIEIHPGARIGKGLFIDHGSGVVIGETTIIGDNCTLYQGVTLGGTGKDIGKRHPTLGNNVMVGAGAILLGPLHIGDNSKIAAGAVVLRNVPENSTAVGVPARVTVKTKETDANGFDLDQTSVPDPIRQEMLSLAKQIKALKKRMDSYENSQ